jgi:WD40 repeat protein
MRVPRVWFTVVLVLLLSQVNLSTAEPPGAEKKEAVKDEDSRFGDGPVTGSVAFSPDGRTLTASSDFSYIPLRLWDASSGAVIRRLAELDPRVPDSCVRCVAFSPDGKHLATGDSVGTVRIGLMDSGRKVRELVGHEGFIVSVAFSADGKLLAVVDEVQALSLWRVATGKRLRCFPLNSLEAVLSPDGKLIASVGGKGGMSLLDASTGRELRRFWRQRGFVRCVAFSPDGKLLASFESDGTVRVRDVATGRDIRRFPSYRLDPGLIDESYEDHIMFSPDGKLLGRW